MCIHLAAEWSKYGQVMKSSVTIRVVWQNQYCYLSNLVIRKKPDRYQQWNSSAGTALIAGLFDLFRLFCLQQPGCELFDHSGF